jgi:hypothetical protein
MSGRPYDQGHVSGVRQVVSSRIGMSALPVLTLPLTTGQLPVPITGLGTEATSGTAHLAVCCPGIQPPVTNERRA